MCRSLLFLLVLRMHRMWTSGTLETKSLPLREAMFFACRNGCFWRPMSFPRLSFGNAIVGRCLGVHQEVMLLSSGAELVSGYFDIGKGRKIAPWYLNNRLKLISQKW